MFAGVYQTQAMSARCTLRSSGARTVTTGVGPMPQRITSAPACTVAVGEYSRLACMHACARARARARAGVCVCVCVCMDKVCHTICIFVPIRIESLTRSPQSCHRLQICVTGTQSSLADDRLRARTSPKLTRSASVDRTDLAHVLLDLRQIRKSKFLSIWSGWRWICQESVRKEASCAHATNAARPKLVELGMC